MKLFIYSFIGWLDWHPHHQGDDLVMRKFDATRNSWVYRNPDRREAFMCEISELSDW